MKKLFKIYDKVSPLLSLFMVLSGAYFIWQNGNPETEYTRYVLFVNIAIVIVYSFLIIAGFVKKARGVENKIEQENEESKYKTIFEAKLEIPYIAFLIILFLAIFSLVYTIFNAIA